MKLIWSKRWLYSPPSPHTFWFLFSLSPPPPLRSELCKPILHVADSLNPPRALLAHSRVTHSLPFNALWSHSLAALTVSPQFTTALQHTLWWSSAQQCSRLYENLICVLFLYRNRQINVSARELCFWELNTLFNLCSSCLITRMGWGKHTSVSIIELFGLCIADVVNTMKLVWGL